MNYVDGYVLAIPTKNIKDYTRIASIAAKVWKEHGALDYRECIGEDMKVKWGVPFPKTMNSKKNETIVFAYVVFKSRAHRDRVNAKVMKDKRITEAMEPSKELFDCTRMVYGGFQTIVGS